MEDGKANKKLTHMSLTNKVLNWVDSYNFQTNLHNFTNKVKKLFGSWDFASIGQMISDQALLPLRSCAPPRPNDVDDALG